jgi:hypothetical protein
MINFIHSLLPQTTRAEHCPTSNHPNQKRNQQDRDEHPNIHCDIHGHSLRKYLHLFNAIIFKILYTFACHLVCCSTHKYGLKKAKSTPPEHSQEKANQQEKRGPDWEPPGGQPFLNPNYMKYTCKTASRLVIMNNRSDA